MDKSSLRQRMSSFFKRGRSERVESVEIATISGREICDETIEVENSGVGSALGGTDGRRRNSRSVHNVLPLKDILKGKTRRRRGSGDPVMPGEISATGQGDSDSKQRRPDKTYHLYFCCCAQVEQEPYSELEEACFDGDVDPSASSDIRELTAEITSGRGQGAFKHLTHPPSRGGHLDPAELTTTAVVTDGAWGGAMAASSSDNGPGSHHEVARASDTAVRCGVLPCVGVSIPKIVVSADVKACNSVELCSDHVHLLPRVPSGACLNLKDINYSSADEMDQTESDSSSSRHEVPTLTRKSSRRQSLSSGFELSRFRKRKHNNENDDSSSDNISIQSFDLSTSSEKGNRMTPHRVTFADDPCEESQHCPTAEKENMKGAGAADGSQRAELGSSELLKPKKRRNSGTDVEVSGDENENCRIRFLSVRQKKSKRSLLRVSTSLVNLISPGRHHKNQQDQDGFKVPSSPSRQPPSPYKPPQPSPAKRRQQLSWVDSFGGGKNAKSLSALSHTDIKRQEAIYELYQGEKDMIEDLENVAKLYRDTLVTLGLMSASDVNTLFGNIDKLLPVHKDLFSRLHAQRRPDGTSQNVGKQIHDWTNKLSAYVTYCANQIKAKAIFDEKKNEPALHDFYQRCLASPFSRKLDLWTLLDGARGRFVKYPLLIRSILKYTPNESEDAIYLEKSVKLMEKIIQEADDATGLARCEHAKTLLIYLYDEQKVQEIQESNALVCSGCMKNTKGSKLHVFLFDKVLLVSRSSQQSGKQMYQVYRQPIPTAELLVEDLPDGEVKLGSFRNAFGQGGQTAKNLIRLSFQESEKGQTHTLIANDEHDKRQWMQAFHKVTSNISVVPETKNKDKQQSAN